MEGNMKKAMAIELLIFLCLFCSKCFAEDSAEILIEAPPEIRQVIGETKAVLAPAKFPQFLVIKQTDNLSCEQWIAANLSSKPICTPSQTGAVYAVCKPDFEDIEGLIISNFKIPLEYRKTSRLLFTWTVRVVGYTLPVKLYPTLCSPWHGTTSQEFLAGDVETQLYVKEKDKAEKPLGQPFVMTIPYGGIVNTSQPYDPTLLGSYLITGADFDNNFLPEEFEYIKVKWRNQSCMETVAPPGMRNLILNFMPFSKDTAPQVEEVK
jgi:hypothetical protein